ncbi:MAG: hypothetical protein AAF664_05720 [Planctomycetota bacterium]
MRGRGWLYTIGIIFNRIIPEAWMRFRPFVVLQLTAAQEFDTPSSDAFRVTRCVTDEQIKAVADITFVGDPSQFPNATGYLISDNDQILGGVWIATGEFTESELGVRLELRDYQVWLFAASIKKEARGQGVYRRLLGQVLSEQEDKRVYCSINRFNKASLAAHRRFTEANQGSALVARVGSRVWASGKGKLTYADRVFRIAD